MNTDQLKTYIDFDEILRYLGYQGQLCKESERAKIKEILEETISLSSIKRSISQCRVQVLDDEINLLDANGAITDRILSKDLGGFMIGAERMIFCGVTLGHDVTRKINQLLLTEASKAVIMDACASVMTDAVCDMIQDEISTEYKAEMNCFSQRFSPGYGDLDLSYQSVFAKHLNLAKYTGIHLTPNFQLIPEKSVIFVMGASQVPFRGDIKTCGSNCSTCKLKFCQFRRPL